MLVTRYPQNLNHSATIHMLRGVRPSPWMRTTVSVGGELATGMFEENGGGLAADGGIRAPLLRPGLADEAEEVAVHDVGDVLGLVASFFEHGGDAGEVGDGVEVFGGLLGAVAAVEIGADA